MAKSLTKLKEQIAKLQKEADAIQSTVIARIKREIAQHGLTATHLFDKADSQNIGSEAKSASTTSKAKVARKPGEKKPAKFTDDQGNSWHGLGKRPQWIHDALSAGRSLDEFLVGAKRPALAAKKPRAAAKVAPKPSKKAVASGKASPTKKVARTTKTAVVAKPSVKEPVKTTAKATSTKTAAAKKQVKAKTAAPATVTAPAVA
jgi:DNA-binding protein H-NS